MDDKVLPAMVFTATDTYLVNRTDVPKLDGETRRIQISQSMYKRLKKQKVKEAKPVNE